MRQVDAGRQAEEHLPLEAGPERRGATVRRTRERMLSCRSGTQPSASILFPPAAKPCGRPAPASSSLMPGSSRCTEGGDVVDEEARRVEIGGVGVAADEGDAGTLVPRTRDGPRFHCPRHHEDPLRRQFAGEKTGLLRRMGHDGVGLLSDGAISSLRKTSAPARRSASPVSSASASRAGNEDRPRRRRWPAARVRGPPPR